MQPRRIARELALLSISQLPGNEEKLDNQELHAIVAAAVHTLTSEAQDSLEAAAAELQQSSARLLNSQIRTTDVEAARTMVHEAVDLAQTAINRLGLAVEIPEYVQRANQNDVMDYTLDIIRTLRRNRDEIDAVLTDALVDWQLSRLARIDRDILRIAVTEMMFIRTFDSVAINEAVELAKRYSGEDGYRFINGVLRRVVDKMRAKKPSN
jgi:transcription antitermination protein NusB